MNKNSIYVHNNKHLLSFCYLDSYCYIIFITINSKTFDLELLEYSMMKLHLDKDNFEAAIVATLNILKFQRYLFRKIIG